MSTRFFETRELAQIAVLAEIWHPTATADLFAIHEANRRAYAKCYYLGQAAPRAATFPELISDIESIEAREVTETFVRDACAMAVRLGYNCDDFRESVEIELLRVEAAMFRVQHTLYFPSFGIRQLEHYVREAKCAKSYRALDEKERAAQRAKALEQPRAEPARVRRTGVCRYDLSGGYPDPGDSCSEELVAEQAECVPPASFSDRYLQVGEAANHDAQGRPRFATFQKIERTWVYVGPLLHGQRAEVV